MLSFNYWMFYFNEAQLIYVLVLWASCLRTVKVHEDPHLFSSKNFTPWTPTLKYLTYAELFFTCGIRKDSRLFHLWISSSCCSIHWCKCSFLIGWPFTILQSNWPSTCSFLCLTWFYITLSGLLFCYWHWRPGELLFRWSRAWNQEALRPQIHSLFHGYIDYPGASQNSAWILELPTICREKKKAIWDFAHI